MKQFFSNLAALFRKESPDAHRSESAPAANLRAFLASYPPASDCIPASQELLQRYQKLLPESMLAVWRDHGFGHYGDGLLTLVNPDDYLSTLEDWLLMDRDDDQPPCRIPLALTAFGELIYLRLLADDEIDISTLNPHNSTGAVHDWSLEDFFNDSICKSELRDSLLQADLFAATHARLGARTSEQIYYPVPALRLGGHWAADSMESGNALVHLDFQLQLALG